MNLKILPLVFKTLKEFGYFLSSAALWTGRLTGPLVRVCSMTSQSLTNYPRRITFYAPWNKLPESGRSSSTLSSYYDEIVFELHRALLEKYLYRPSDLPVQLQLQAIPDRINTSHIIQHKWKQSTRTTCLRCSVYRPVSHTPSSAETNIFTCVCD